MSPFTCSSYTSPSPVPAGQTSSHFKASRVSPILWVPTVPTLSRSFLSKGVFTPLHQSMAPGHSPCHPSRGQLDSHHSSVSAGHFPLQSIQYSTPKYSIFHYKVFNPLTFIIKYRFIAHSNTPREASLTTFLHGPSAPIKWMYSLYAMKHLTVLHFCNFDYAASTLVKISFLIFSHSEISGSFMAQFKSFFFMKDHPYKAHADWTFILLLENPLPLHLDCGSRKGRDTISSFLSEPNIVLDQDLSVKTLTWNLR